MRKICIIAIAFIMAYLGTIKSIKNTNIEKNNFESINNVEQSIETKNKIDDWKLTLVNYENVLPDNFEIELANIDNTRQFDARAIN